MTLTNLVRARVDAPQFVEYSSGTVTIPVRCELTNVGPEEFAVSAPSRDEALFWHVLNDQHREVARRPPGETAAEGAMHSETVATAHPSHEAFDVMIDAAKLKNGRTYTLRVEIFGIGAETKFVAVSIPVMAAPSSAASSKPTKKSNTKKPATKSKSTRK